MGLKMKNIIDWQNMTDPDIDGAYMENKKSLGKLMTLWFFITCHLHRGENQEAGIITS